MALVERNTDPSDNGVRVVKMKKWNWFHCVRKKLREKLTSVAILPSPLFVLISIWLSWFCFMYHVETGLKAPLTDPVTVPGSLCSTSSRLDAEVFLLHLCSSSLILALQVYHQMSSSPELRSGLWFALQWDWQHPTGRKLMSAFSRLEPSVYLSHTGGGGEWWGPRCG